MRSRFARRLAARRSNQNFFLDLLTDDALAITALIDVTSFGIGGCPLGDEVAMPLFQSPELRGLFIDTSRHASGFFLRFTQLILVVRYGLLGGRQLTLAADQPTGQGGGPDDGRPIVFQQFTTGGDESQAGPTELSQPQSGFQRIDQPGAAEQMLGQRFEHRFALDHPVATSDDPFESVEPNAIPRPATGQVHPSESGPRGY